MKQITRTIQITPDACEIGALFASLPSDDMAAFFSEAARCIERTYPHGMGSFAMQLQYVTDDDTLTEDGRRVMEYIGEYARRCAV
jgi:hypothetical protein